MRISELENIIKEDLPEKAGLCKIELLGPYITIFIKNPEAIYETNESVVKKIASKLKKNVLIRTDQAYLIQPEEAKKIIEEIIDKEAGITNIMFDTIFSEVHIEAKKPGIVIGKGGSKLREILIKTKWSPVILREPTMPSFTIEGLRKSDIINAAERKKFLVNIGKKLLEEPKKTSWIRTGMFGGFREVGRSCLLVQTNNSKILIDCGVNPAGIKPEDAFPFINLLGFPINELDAVIITHAHTDHMAFLPFLFAAGYDGPVYMTAPTRDLTAILQRDYINVTKKYLGRDPPYGKKDIQKELKNIITIPYQKVVNITPEIKLTFHNAGHVLGSSIVHLHVSNEKFNIVHSGDLKFGFTHLFNPADTSFQKVDALFIESTYGGRNDIMPNRTDAERRLIGIIKETIEKKKGHVLIPVFALGRSQEIILTLENYAQKNEWNIPVYIDGLILEVSAIHTAYPDYLKNSIKKRILSNDSPFKWEYLKQAYGKDKTNIINDEPAVILAPSGMLTGGPSYEYLKLLAEDKRNTIIFVGYQASMSLGARIQEGIKEIPITDEKNGKLKKLNINIQVETVEGFSGHSDRKQLLAWIANLPKPRKVYVMHGENSKTLEFARYVNKKLGISTSVPYNLEFRRLL